MANIATAYVQIVPTTKGISGSISSAMGGEASAAGDSAGSLLGNGLVSKVVGIIAAAKIGETIVKGISAAVSAGADLEQSIGGVQTLFANSMGDASEIVIENAKKAYKTAGVSANQYMEQATSFSAALVSSLSGDVTKAAEVTDTAITDMADNSNKMGTNLQDIQNAYQGFAKQNYTMLDNLKLGYGGTQAEMKRLLKDAQKISGVKYDISNLSDVYEAIHVIQEDLNITGTTALEASTTVSGSFNMMKAAAENALGAMALGENVGPCLEELASTVSNFLFHNLIPMIGKVIASIPEAVKGFVTGAFDSIKAQFDSLGTDLENSFGDAADAIREKAKTAYQDVGMSAKDYLSEATSLAGSLVDALGGDVTKAAEAASTAIADMADNYAKTGTSLSTLKEAYQGFTEQNYDMLDTLSLGYGSTREEMERLLQDAQAISGVEYNIDNLADVYNAIHVIQTELGFTGTAAENASSTVSGSFDAMKAAAENVVGAIANGEGLAESMSAFEESFQTFLYGNLIPSISAAVSEVVSYGAEVIPQFIEGIIQHIPDVMESGGQILLKLWEGTQENLPTLAQNFGSLVGNIARAIITNLPQIITTGFQVISQLIFGILTALPTFLPNVALGFLSGLQSAFDGVDWGQLGRDLITALINGILTLGFSLSAALVSIAETISGWFGDVGTNTSTNVSTIVNDVANWFMQLPGNILNAIDPAVQNIANWGANMLSTAVSAASNLLSSVGSTLSAMPGRIWSAISGAISSVISWGASLASAGLSAAGRLVSTVISGVSSLPSQMMSVGANIVSGIIQGVTNAASSLFSTLQDLASSALSAAKKALGIKSPSRVFRDQVGQWIPAGIAAGISGNADIVEDAMKELESPLSGELNSAIRVNANATASGLSSAGKEALTAKEIYAAIKAGMQDATIVTKLNEREVGRSLKGMGVSFA